MATYRLIADTETDPQAPVTSALMKALDANATAMFEGDNTAAAAGRTLRLGALERLVVGESIRLRNDAVVVAGTTAVNSLGHQFVQFGFVRFRLEHRITGGATSTAFIARTRAGVTTTEASWPTGSTSFVQRFFDGLVQPGDMWFIGHQSSSAVLSELRFSRVSLADGVFLWPSATNLGFIENPLL